MSLAQENAATTPCNKKRPREDEESLEEEEIRLVSESFLIQDDPLDHEPLTEDEKPPPDDNKENSMPPSTAVKK